MNTQLTALIALTRKDILLYLGNRKALFVSLVAPIVMAAFFGYVLNPGGNKKPSQIPIAIVDQDNSNASRAIVHAMQNDATVDVLLIEEKDAVALVRAGKRRAAVVLPAGFGENVFRAVFSTHPKPEIVVHVDPSQSFVAAIVDGLLAQHAIQGIVSTRLASGGLAQNVGDVAKSVVESADLNTTQKRNLTTLLDNVLTVQRSFSGADKVDVAKTGGDTGIKLSMPFRTTNRDVTANELRKYNSFAHSFAGMSVQFILFTGIEFGIGLLLMQKMGLWKRLTIAPINKSTIIASRIAASSGIAVVFVSVIYAVAIAAFGVRVDGSWLGFAGVTIAFALLTASFGLLIAALGRTPETARGIAIFATLVLVMLGGAWVPSFIFPEWLQLAAKFTPAYWAVEGFSGMTWRGQEIAAALPPIAAMCGFTALFTLIAVWRFRVAE